jgi:hypothetical protein
LHMAETGCNLGLCRAFSAGLQAVTQTGASASCGLLAPLLLLLAVLLLTGALGLLAWLLLAWSLLLARPLLLLLAWSLLLARPLLLAPPLLQLRPVGAAAAVVARLLPGHLHHHNSIRSRQSGDAQPVLNTHGGACLSPSTHSATHQ